MKNRIRLLTLLLFISSYSFSKKDPPVIKAETPLSASVYVKNQTDSIVAVTYKMLYDNQVKSNDAVLKTIFYALGGLGSAMIFVFASNWWFNEKKVSEIKKGISTQVTTETNKAKEALQQEITANITSLTALFNEFMEKHRLEIKEDNKTLLENYQTQLKSFSENINIQIATLKTSADERIAALQKTQETNKAQVEKAIEQITNKVELANKRLKINMLESEATLWLMKNVPINALRCYIEAGSLSVGGEQLWNLKYVFRDLTEVLNKIDSVRQSDVTSFDKFINLVPADTMINEKTSVVELFNKKTILPDKK